MTQQNKTLFGLAIAQVVCLAVGLWIQDRFVISAAKWQAKGNPSPPLATGGINAPETADGQTAPDLSADSIIRSMPTARLIALVWIGGAQIGIAYLIMSRIQTESSQAQMHSMKELLRRERELMRTRNAVIVGLAKLAEYRDWDTGQHLERIALYSNCLATELRRDVRYRAQISASFVKTIGISSVLHDIGKVGIEDAVLRKPGKLDEDERARMQRHTTIAGQCIRQIERQLGNSNFLEMAREIALCHHERWDGEGYPRGLVGDEIPLAARIVAIADVYDALSSKRVYKPAFPHEKCMEIIRDEAGRHLDPALVEVFLSIESQFSEIAVTYVDTEEEPDHSDTPPGDLPADETAPRDANGVLIDSAVGT